MFRYKIFRTLGAPLTVIAAGALLSACSFELPSFVDETEPPASIEPAGAAATDAVDEIATGSIKQADDAGTVTVVQVVQGDSLASIARLHGIGWLELAETNRIHPPYTISAGQTLVLPSARR